MSVELFDIVIPVGPNELNNLSRQIEFTRKNVIGFRRIFLVSYDPKINIDGCTTIDERIFPFNIDDVAANISRTKSDRNGWYLQQLLKLYAGFVIPDITKQYLVIDADLFFLRPLHFINNDGKPIFTSSSEKHLPYFEHMKRIHPSFDKINEKSGISHHMMFHVDYLTEMISAAETYHQEKPFWLIFLNCIEEKHYEHSGASEYEMYFNFMCKYFPDHMVVRELDWRNIAHRNISQMDQIATTSRLDFVSLCWYI